MEEKKSVWVMKKICGVWYWEIGNVAKGAIFEKFRFLIINSTIKKLPKA